MELYLTQLQELPESLGAKSPVELKLVETIADGYWRLDRFRCVEEETLSRSLARPDDAAAQTISKDLNLSLYESKPSAAPRKK